MGTQFESELKALEEDMASARAELLSVVGALSDADLLKARRGGWAITRVLEHVIDAERMYAAVVSGITGVSMSEAPVASATSVANATACLAATRGALRQAMASATEESFYRLQRFGHEEYSVASVLENVANHDREHVEQIHRTVAG